MANMNNFMKQAQTLQANMQRGAGRNCATRGHRRIRRRHGQGRHERTARGQARTDRPGDRREDREMLEDLIAAAINDAVHRVEAGTQAKMAAAWAGSRCRRA
jgi:hypothetical protein